MNNQVKPAPFAHVTLNGKKYLVDSEGVWEIVGQKLRMRFADVAADTATSVRACCDAQVDGATVERFE